MPPGKYAQGLKGVEQSDREEAFLKREITRRVARGESLDELLGHISGLIVEVAYCIPARKISFYLLRFLLEKVIETMPPKANGAVVVVAAVLAADTPTRRRRLRMRRQQLRLRL